MFLNRGYESMALQNQVFCLQTIMGNYIHCSYRGQISFDEINLFEINTL